MNPVSPIFLICIAALPVVHILTGAAIPFGNDGSCDAWYYFGLMEFPELGHILAPTARTISRLPAYVPISLWHEIGATATGQQLYFWFCHTIFTVATAVALTALFEIRTALVVTTLLTTSELYLAILSTTYPTGAALAYGAVALACVSISVRRPMLVVPLSFVGGVFVAFALHSNLVSAVFLFFLPILYGVIGIQAFLAGAALVVAGILVGTAFVGLTGLYLGQGFWSFENQISAATSGTISDWYEGWITHSIGLLLMVLLPALQIITWARKRHSKRSLIILASAIAVSAVNLVLTLAHSETLIYNFMYVMAIPIAALVFADAIEDSVARLSPGTCGLILVVLAIFHVAIVAYLRRYVFFYFMPIAIAGAVLALCISIFYERLRSAVFGMAIIGSLFIFAQAALGDTFAAHLWLDRPATRWNTQQIDKALRFMRSYGITDKPIVWLGKVDNEALELGTFRSLVRCGFSTNFPDQLPDGSLQWQPPIAAGRLLIVMDNPKNYPDVKDALAKKGVSIQNAKSENVNDSFRVTIGRVVAGEPNNQPQ